MSDAGQPRLVVLAASALSGELARIGPGTFAPRALLSVAYLVVIGSVIGHSAYNYLLARTTPARVGSFAYVNPVVAVVLGWLVGRETFSAQALAAGGMIVAGVALIVTGQWSAEEEKVVTVG